MAEWLANSALSASLLSEAYCTSITAISFPFLQSIRRKYSCSWVQRPSLLSNKLQMITVYFDAFRIPLLVTVLS